MQSFLGGGNKIQLLSFQKLNTVRQNYIAIIRLRLLNYGGKETRIGHQEVR
jgi:hypothetical protein